MAAKKTIRKKKVKKNIQTGVAHIQSTFNNTVVTITDVGGDTIAWSSSGQQGFKGSRKTTPFAAQMAAEDCAKKAMEHGVRTLGVYVKGPGAGREARPGCKARVAPVATAAPTDVPAALGEASAAGGCGKEDQGARAQPDCGGAARSADMADQIRSTSAAPAPC